MYQLLTFCQGQKGPRSKTTVEAAPEAMKLLQTLLAANDDCERVVMMHDGVRLFSVDAAGNREP